MSEKETQKRRRPPLPKPPRLPKRPTSKTKKSDDIAEHPPKKRRKSIPLHRANRKPLSDTDRQSEYRSMGCAYMSTAFKILSMACGETSAEIQRAIDPEMAERTAFECLLEKIDKVDNDGVDKSMSMPTSVVTASTNPTTVNLPVQSAGSCTI